MIVSFGDLRSPSFHVCREIDTMWAVCVCASWKLSPTACPRDSFFLANKIEVFFLNAISPHQSGYYLYEPPPLGSVR